MREREGGETQLERKRKVQETHFLIYMNVFCGQVFYSSCSCFENEHTRQQKYTTMPKNLDFYGDSHPYRKSPRQTLSEIKKKRWRNLAHVGLTSFCHPHIFPTLAKLGRGGFGGCVGVVGGLMGTE